MRGILILRKPPGITSRDLMDRIVRLVPRTKVGHAGTLDPLASGVLLVCLGSATRLIELLQRLPKTYRAIVRLGARSDTLDADGQVVEVDDPAIPTEEQLRLALAGQVGEIRQLPPQYSALKVKGQRAYELARAGRTVDLQPRVVRIDRAELVSYQWPHLELEIECGSGTYIRSIARDVGEEAGCGGLIERLVRTRIGPFTLEDSLDGENLSQESISRHLRPLRDAVADLPTITLDESQAAQIVQGRSLDAAGLAINLVPPGEIALLCPDGRLLALARGDQLQATIHPHKVFP